MSSLAQIQARLEARKRSASDGAAGGPAKRWRRKGDVDAEAEAAYRAEAQERARVREERSAAEAAAEAAAIAKERERLERKKERGVGEKAAAGGDGLAEGDVPLAREEVVRRLRALGAPATFYGENDWMRWRRLREITLAKELEGHGQKNVFQDKMREMERADARRKAHEYAGAEYDEDAGVVDGCAAGGGHGGVEGGGTADGSGGCVGAGSAGRAAKKDTVKGAGGRAAVEGGDDEPSCSEEYVLRELRRLVGLWQGDVDGMAPEVRQTKDGRTAAVTLEQTKEWLKPLTKKLRRRRLAPDILSALVRIFRAVEEREYVKANSAYYEHLAIGNAPWPMGATNVGIHARAAREKIGEDKIAHVMNDEESRKYIQAVKRLVSLCQKHYPNVPSKMISS